eukprot:30101-Eustigmatos_ZCMA.PRE.1
MTLQASYRQGLSWEDLCLVFHHSGNNTEFMEAFDFCQQVSRHAMDDTIKDTHRTGSLSQCRCTLLAPVRERSVLQAWALLDVELADTPWLGAPEEVQGAR